MDGSVFIAGGEAPLGGAYSSGSYNAEVFKPPYMDDENKRVLIQQAPSVAQMNAEQAETVTFQVVLGELNPESTPVHSVVLTRPGAVTHFFDADQRYIELKYSPLVQTQDNETLTVVSPQANLGPPGYYLLWVVTREVGSGELIPSQATIVYFQ